MIAADPDRTVDLRAEPIRAPQFLVRVHGGAQSESSFRGTAALLAPEYALTCKHVVEGIDPLGRPTGERLPEILIETATGRRIPVRSLTLDAHRDLALLVLGSPVEEAPFALMLTGLTRGLEERLRRQALFLFGFAERDPDAALWMHAVADRRGMAMNLRDLPASPSQAAGTSSANTLS